MTLDTKITIPDTLFLQTVDDETILLDTETQEYFSLNESGTMIWNILEEKKNLKEVQETILDMYEIDENQVESDILKFVEALKEKKLIFVN